MRGSDSNYGGAVAPAPVVAALGDEEVVNEEQFLGNPVVQFFLRELGEPLDRDGVTEIAINKPGEMWIEANSTWERLPSDLDDESVKRLGLAVATMTQQTWDVKTPLLSASLNNGTRMQFCMPPASDGGYSLTLRKPAKLSYSLEDFRAQGLFEYIQPAQNKLAAHEMELLSVLEGKDYYKFLKLAVHHRLNLVVSGATGSGKTTFMKGLVKNIPHSERLITIEDSRELYLEQPNRVHLVYSKGAQSIAKVTPKDLLISCLRMKPDRILLAEVRGDECLYFVRNAASGHPGSMTSCHAGTPALAFEQMALMIQDSPGGANMTFDVIKRLLLLTIDVVIQFQNHAGKRFISEIYYDPARRLEIANGR